MTGVPLPEVQASSMKIAHVVDSMEVGGAETLVSQMCRLQREQGHDPCVYAWAKLGALGEQMRKRRLRGAVERGLSLAGCHAELFSHLQRVAARRCPSS